MKVDLERSTLVIVGAWNQAIFTESWVRANVFHGPETVSMEVGTSPQGLIPRYTGGAFRLIVRPDRLIWAPMQFRDDALLEMEKAAVGLLGMLSVTPIHAVGINFGFDVAKGASSAESALKTEDAELFARARITPRSALVKRTFLLEQRTVNFAVSKEESGPLHLDINFHEEADGAPQAKARIEGGLVASKHAALALVEGLYGLKLESSS